MANDRYSEYLNSGAWQAKRIRFLANRSVCECCKNTDAPVDIHHLTYERIFNELDSDLMALCRRCHRNAEREISSGRLSRHGDTNWLRQRTLSVLRYEKCRPVVLLNPPKIKRKLQFHREIAVKNAEFHRARRIAKEARKAAEKVRLEKERAERQERYAAQLEAEYKAEREAAEAERWALCAVGD